MEQLVSLLNLAPAKTDKQGSTSLKSRRNEGEEAFKTTLDEAFQAIETHGINGTEITAKAVVSSRTAKENLAEEKEIRDIKSIKDIKDIIRLSSEKKLNLKSLTVEIRQEGGADKKLVIKRGEETEKNTPKIMLTASQKMPISKEPRARDAQSGIDLKELIARLDKEDKETKDTKTLKHETDRETKQADNDTPISKGVRQVKSSTGRPLETKVPETKAPEIEDPKQPKLMIDEKHASGKNISVKEKQTVPQTSKQPAGSQKAEPKQAAPKEPETPISETRPLGKVPPESKSSSAKSTTQQERTPEQNVPSDTSPKTAATRPDDPAVRQEAAKQKPLPKEQPAAVAEKTDKQEKLSQESVQSVQQQNSLKEVSKAPSAPIPQKSDTTEIPEKPTIRHHETESLTQDTKQAAAAQSSVTKSMPPVQDAKPKTEPKKEHSAAPVKPTLSGETTKQTQKEASPVPLRQTQADPSPKSTATPPASKQSKQENTPVRSQKTDLAELLRKQLRTKPTAKTSQPAEGVAQTAKTMPVETPAADSQLPIKEKPAETPTTNSQPPIEAKQTETRTPQTTGSSQKITREAIKNTTRNADSTESAAEEKRAKPHPDEEQNTAKGSKPADPLKSVQKTQTTGTSASLNALIASKKAESKETKKMHPVKSDGDIKPMPLRQTASPEVNEMPQADRDLISKMVSANISSIAAGTIKSDALFDDTVQKAKTGMETALESISQNEETGDETIRDAAKPDDVKTDTVKSRVTAARATVNHFVNDLKERIETYKAPLMKITLDLNPKNLGSVGVTLLNRGKNLHVQIHSNSRAIQLFMQNNADFKNALNDLGYRDVQLGFSSGQGSSAGHDGGRGGYREQESPYYGGQTRDQPDGNGEEMEIILPNIVYG